MSDEDHADVKRAWRELGDEPVPPALDARVREMARAALAARAEPQGAPATNVVDLAVQRARRRWLVPASLAASVVLAFGLAQRVQEQSPAGASDLARMQTESATSVPGAPASASDVAVDATAADVAATDAAAKRRAAPDAAARPPHAAADVDDGAAATPARAPRRAPATRAYSPPPAVLEGAYSAQRAGAAPPAAPAAAYEAESAAPRPPASTPAPTPAPAADGDSARLESSRAPAPRAFPAQKIAPAAAMRTLPAEVPAGAPAAAASAGARAADEPASELRVEPMPEAHDAAAKQERDGRARAAAQRTPEQWLDDIEALRRAGRTAEAEAELARFRSAFPEWRDR